MTFIRTFKAVREYDSTVLIKNITITPTRTLAILIMIVIIIIITFHPYCKAQAPIHIFIAVTFAFVSLGSLANTPLQTVVFDNGVLEKSLHDI